MHAVHDVGHERHRLLAEPPVEVERLPDGLRGRPRHQDETRGGIAQERVHALRPLLEPIVHPLEGQEELGEVPQELQAQEAVDQTEGHGPGSGGDLEGQAAGHEVRPEEVPQDARVEEAHQAVRGVQEVEGVAGGRSIEHDEVEALVGRELQELLHGHVLVAPRQGAKPRRGRTASRSRQRCSWCRGPWPTGSRLPRARSAAGRGSAAYPRAGSGRGSWPAAARGRLCRRAPAAP